MYIGQGYVSLTEDDIPKWTQLTKCIIEAWKAECKQFHQEMKVCWTCSLLACGFPLLIVWYFVEVFRPCVAYNRCMVNTKPRVISRCHGTLHRTQQTRSTIDLKVWIACVPAHSGLTHWWTPCWSSLQDYQRGWHRAEGVLVSCHIAVVWMFLC